MNTFYLSVLKTRIFAYNLINFHTILTILIHFYFEKKSRIVLKNPLEKTSELQNACAKLILALKKNVNVSPLNKEIHVNMI